MTPCDFDSGLLIDEFVTESSEGLEMAMDDILSLEQGPDSEAVDCIFRVVHSIKGAAGMLNFTALSGFVHALEDTCSDIRSGHRTVDGPMADALLRCLDFIQSRLDFIRINHREDDESARGQECLRALQAAPPAPATPVVESPIKPDAATPAPSRAGSVHPDIEGRGCGAGLAATMDEFLRLAGDGREHKALIVEDDFMSRRMLHSFLSRYMPCYVAKDGSEAIQAVTESYGSPNPEPFSLIFMDVMMPIIDGLQATKAIRALERAKGAGHNLPKSRIVIATSLDDDITEQTAIHECGADTYMVKPLRLDQVAASCLSMVGQIRA